MRPVRCFFAMLSTKCSESSSAILTTDANDEVSAIHPKAMPVILTQADEVEAWLSLPVVEALQMQKPRPTARS